MTYYTLLSVLALHLALQSTARPSAEPVRMALHAAAARASCPLNVTLDVDPARVPRVIKLIRCGTRRRHCCRERAACVELHDDVLVTYPRGLHDDPALTHARLSVPVGCVCVPHSAEPARDSPDPD